MYPCVRSCLRHRIPDHSSNNYLQEGGSTFTTSTASQLDGVLFCFQNRTSTGCFIQETEEIVLEQALLYIYDWLHVRLVMK